MGSDTAIVSNVNIAEEVRMKKKTKKRKRYKEREMETTRAKLSGGGEEVEAEVTVHRVQGAPLIRHIHLTFLSSLILVFFLLPYSYVPRGQIRLSCDDFCLLTQVNTGRKQLQNHHNLVSSGLSGYVLSEFSCNVVQNYRRIL